MQDRGNLCPREENAMPITRRLGSHGLEVSALGLGCLGMSQSYGSPDDQESIATIHRAIELGVTLFDTAEAYGPFKNEELLARALQGKQKGATPAQIALAWLLHKGDDIVPIPGRREGGIWKKMFARPM